MMTKAKGVFVLATTKDLLHIYITADRRESYSQERETKMFKSFRGFFAPFLPFLYFQSFLILNRDTYIKGHILKTRCY